MIAKRFLMNEPSTQSTTANKHALQVMRVAWVGFAVFAAWLIVRGAIARFMELTTVSDGALQFVGQLTPADASQLAKLGLSPSFFAAYFTVAETAIAVTFAAMAWLIFLRRPREWFALYVSTFFCLVAAVLPTGSALQRSGILDPLVLRLALACFIVCFLVFPFYFPDGRPVPRWARGLVAIWVGYGLVGLAVPTLLPPSAFGAGVEVGQIGPLVWLVSSFAVGIVAQAYRYLKVATSVQRQQTKGVIFGLAACFGLMLLGIVVVNASSNPDGRVNYMALRIAGPTLILIGAAFIPVSIGFSILRYRLWDIDVIIRKTLVYSALTALLAVIYFGSVILLQRLFGALTGIEQSPLAVVVSTLAIAALFTPLRRRIQDALDRRFFRKKYNAQQVLAQYSITARDETDMNALTSELARVVQETLEPEMVSVWLKAAKGERPFP